LYSFSNGTQDVSANSVCVSGNSVYVAGRMRPRGTTNFTGKVWKNGTELYSFNGSVSKMCISNNDIYVSGSKVWKNGVEYWAPNVTGYSPSIHHIYAAGGNIYASFNFTSSNLAYIAKINEGYTFTSLYTHGNSSMSNYTATAYYFAISASGDVYAGVNVVQTPGNMYVAQARIYKNDKLLYEKGGSGEMYLLGEDVYHCRTYNNKTTVCKNETELYVLIDGGSIYDGVSDILVVEN